MMKKNFSNRPLKEEITKTAGRFSHFIVRQVDRHCDFGFWKTNELPPWEILSLFLDERWTSLKLCSFLLLNRFDGHQWARIFLLCFQQNDAHHRFHLQTNQRLTWCSKKIRDEKQWATEENSMKNNVTSSEKEFTRINEKIRRAADTNQRICRSSTKKEEKLTFVPEKIQTTIDVS